MTVEEELELADLREQLAASHAREGQLEAAIEMARLRDAVVAGGIDRVIAAEIEALQVTLRELTKRGSCGGCDGNGCPNCMPGHFGPAVPGPRPHHLAWNGTEWIDTRCGCRYHPDDDNGSHNGAPHVHRCEKHRGSQPDAPSDLGLTASIMETGAADRWIAGLFQQRKADTPMAVLPKDQRQRCGCLMGVRVITVEHCGGHGIPGPFAVADAAALLQHHGFTWPDPKKEG